MSRLLEVEGLSVTFRPGQPDEVPAVVEAEFGLDDGEILGLVGESGCGKSVTSRALLGLLPDGARVRGTLNLQSKEYNLASNRVSKLRGRQVGMVFQDPMGSLNPLYTVGDQLRETLRTLHPDAEDGFVDSRCLELLDRVGMDDSQRRARSYPHQLSGGLRQRATLALALAGDPDLIVADEPTSALDVTLQRRIMELFEELARDEGLGVLLISHDLPLVGRYTDRISVMYSGYTVETGPADRMVEEPSHPYTQGLVASSRALEEGEGDRLPVIPGDVPSPEERPDGCPFHPRCSEAEDRCRDEFPPDYELGDGLRTACWAREGDVR